MSITRHSKTVEVGKGGIYGAGKKVEKLEKC
jgi:hypothetical protein